MAGGVIKLHGKDYKTVALRVSEFRAKHPISDGWGVITSLVSIDDKVVVFRASIVHPNGCEVAIGFAEESRSASKINRTSAVENCETSAIGRALAAAGYAGQEYASADELVGALNQQKPQPSKPKPWAGPERDRWDRALKDRGIDPVAVDRFALDQGWGKICDWADQDRMAFIQDIDTGAFPALKPPQRLPTPADKRRAEERARRPPQPSKGVEHQWDRSGGDGPRGACLNRGCCAIKGQGHDSAPCPWVAPGEKHPDWIDNNRWFMGKLKGIMGRTPDYAHLANTLQSHGCKRPSRCNRGELEALLDQLKAKDCPEFLRHFTADPPKPLDMTR